MKEKKSFIKYFDKIISNECVTLPKITQLLDGLSWIDQMV